MCVFFMLSKFNDFEYFAFNLNIDFLMVNFLIIHQTVREGK